ncbi:hypothetical protein C9374_003828 [Naegleria lovaniensis]|uniref:Uncharacterized protein n=1 Tax=Naegleria lovaniensis TaxID=51637 RepID=A0AA88H0N4_NAELO|nr:uncharacterized protein C9374_003828 [Naegleria lovaniensis]KAG2394064.1 hypothetical protein C9374_003828 [Naegleria lovaniensis]
MQQMPPASVGEKYPTQPIPSAEVDPIHEEDSFFVDNVYEDKHQASSSADTKKVSSSPTNPHSQQHIISANVLNISPIMPTNTTSVPTPSRKNNPSSKNEASLPKLSSLTQKPKSPYETRPQTAPPKKPVLQKTPSKPKPEEPTIVKPYYIDRKKPYDESKVKEFMKKKQQELIQQKVESKKAKEEAKIKKEQVLQKLEAYVQKVIVKPKKKSVSPKKKSKKIEVHQTVTTVENLLKKRSKTPPSTAIPPSSIRKEDKPKKKKTKKIGSDKKQHFEVENEEHTRPFSVPLNDQEMNVFHRTTQREFLYDNEIQQHRNIFIPSNNFQQQIHPPPSHKESKLVIVNTQPQGNTPDVQIHHPAHRFAWIEQQQQPRVLNDHPEDVDVAAESYQHKSQSTPPIIQQSVETNESSAPLFIMNKNRSPQNTETRLVHSISSISSSTHTQNPAIESDEEILQETETETFKSRYNFLGLEPTQPLSAAHLQSSPSPSKDTPQSKNSNSKVPSPIEISHHKTSPQNIIERLDLSRLHNNGNLSPRSSLSPRLMQPKSPTESEILFVINALARKSRKLQEAAAKKHETKDVSVQGVSEEISVHKLKDAQVNTTPQQTKNLEMDRQRTIMLEKKLEMEIKQEEESLSLLGKKAEMLITSSQQLYEDSFGDCTSSEDVISISTEYEERERKIEAMKMELKALRIKKKKQEAKLQQLIRSKRIEQKLREVKNELIMQDKKLGVSYDSETTSTDNDSILLSNSGRRRKLKKQQEQQVDGTPQPNIDEEGLKKRIESELKEQLTKKMEEDLVKKRKEEEEIIRRKLEEIEADRRRKDEEMKRKMEEELARKHEEIKRLEEQNNLKKRLEEESLRMKMEELKKQEELLKQKERDLLLRKQEEDLRRQKEEAEHKKEIERQIRQALEQEMKMKKEHEEALLKQLEEEQNLRRKHEQALQQKIQEEANLKKQLEENILCRKKMDDETLLRQKALEQEELLRRNAEKEEALKKKLAQEEILRKQIELELEISKKKELELQRQQEDQTKMQQLMLEEEKLRSMLENEEKKRKTLEQLAQKQKEDEEHLKSLLETERLTSKRLEQQVNESRMRLEEQERLVKLKEEQMKHKQLEQDEKLRKEIEQATKQKEQELKRKIEEEFKQREEHYRQQLFKKPENKEASVETETVYEDVKNNKWSTEEITDEDQQNLSEIEDHQPVDDAEVVNEEVVEEVDTSVTLSTELSSTVDDKQNDHNISISSNEFEKEEFTTEHDVVSNKLTNVFDDTVPTPPSRNIEDDLASLDSLNSSFNSSFNSPEQNTDVLPAHSVLLKEFDNSEHGEEEESFDDHYIDNHDIHLIDKELDHIDGDDDNIFASNIEPKDDDTNFQVFTKLGSAPVLKEAQKSTSVIQTKEYIETLVNSFVNASGVEAFKTVGAVCPLIERSILESSAKPNQDAFDLLILETFNTYITEYNSIIQSEHAANAFKGHIFGRVEESTRKRKTIYNKVPDMSPLDFAFERLMIAYEFSKNEKFVDHTLLDIENEYLPKHSIPLIPGVVQPLEKWKSTNYEEEFVKTFITDQLFDELLLDTAQSLFNVFE